MVAIWFSQPLWPLPLPLPLPLWPPLSLPLFLPFFPPMGAKSLPVCGRGGVIPFRVFGWAFARAHCDNKPYRSVVSFGERPHHQVLPANPHPSPDRPRPIGMHPGPPSTEPSSSSGRPSSPSPPPRTVYVGFELGASNCWIVSSLQK